MRTGTGLPVMFTEAGFDVHLYDPLYAPDADALQGCYDFVTCSEVVEHFRFPGQEFTALWDMLSPGGWLGIMTKLVIDRQAFSRWHYKNDPTHISFFSRETFSVLAERLSADLQIVGSDVVLLRKSL
ncbi:MAG: class I SAM-dependent methyltransferase [Syntrophotaleaceae bacterium]